MASFSRLVLTAFAVLASCQFPPEPKGMKTVKSKFHEGITISYKEPGICETTEGVKSYSGYVHLPPNALNEPGEAQNYPINTFFWFFEARKDPHNAPLSIWLNGGPGGSSLIGALAENGPCTVTEDSNSTYLNPWAWNNEVNMLYIDQPNQVGFSYGIPTNVTVNMLGTEEYRSGVQVADFSNGVPEQNNTFLVGTFGTQNHTFTANSTNHSAIALWHFAQTWFEEFPAYKPSKDQSSAAAVSLWTESYGGHYGPAITSYFQHQNERISTGDLQGSGAHYIQLDTLGIINGCVDSLLQDRAYLDFAHHNTYGIKAIDDETYINLLEQILGPGGSNEWTRRCRKLARELDPSNIGDVDHVNEVCRNASDLSGRTTYMPYMGSGKYGWYDITHPRADAFPGDYLSGYLNQRWVQEALGVPVNFSMASNAVGDAFNREGDMQRSGQLQELAYVLDSGIKVALMYGDRDYACNWIGGEVVSQRIQYERQADFLGAGYAPIFTNPFYSGGQTRQFGNFSFSRIYQAGHMVPSYQPETAYKVFMRAMFNQDIATGMQDLHDELATEGPQSTWHHLNDPLPPPEPICYTRGMGLMCCTDEQKDWLRDGTAIVKDWIVVGREKSKVVDKAMPAQAVDAQAPLAAEL